MTIIIKRSTQIGFALALMWFLEACHDYGSNESIPPVSDVTKNIKEIKTIMPHAGGYDVFETHCISCHSLRYIQMQPDFPQKKWETIVDKMVKNFGAPIPDSTSKMIVAYLTEVKGGK